MMKSLKSSLQIREARVKVNADIYAQKDLMVTLAHNGRHREAVELAETVLKQVPNEPGSLIDVTSCFAVCSSLGPSANVDKATHDLYVTRAIECLKRAIDAGYGDIVNLETESDLDAIRDDPTFKKLLTELATSAK